MTAAGDDEIRVALRALERLVEARVRAEQLVHQLTRLPNQSALNETLRGMLEQGEPFWVAFIEVDRFKSINDAFGYETADALLQKIAELLLVACSWFGDARAFHAHGDEFYLVGPSPGVDATAKSLDLVREAIRAITVLVVQGQEMKEMKCTVSIGWLSNSALGTTQAGGSTYRSVLDALERAVAEAKRTRDTVSRYSADFERDDAISLRADCSACGTKFSVDVKRSANRDGESFACPNCKVDVDRPAPPGRPLITPQPVI